MLKPEETAAGFVAQGLASAAAEVALDEEARTSLAEDAAALGFFGLLSSLAVEGIPDPDPAVRAELADVLVRDLQDALGSGESSLDALMTEFSSAKGERGSELLARLVARVTYEVYDLRAHRFVQEDALLAGEVMASGGPGQDARELARRITRLSRLALRHVLGHLDGQIDLVHRLANPEAPVLYPEIEARMEDFAPRIFAQRLPSLAGVLLKDEKRFRFAFVLWCRLRGVVIGRDPLLAVADLIDPKRPLDLLQALASRRAARAALRKADEAFPAAARIEAALRGRPLG